MLDLSKIREEIDEVDGQLVRLYEKRIKLSTDVANYKIANGKKVFDEQREKEKLRKVSELVENPENVHGVNELFSQLMATSRKFQYKLLEENGLTLREPYESIDRIDKDGCTVVYQGVPGAYSYIAMKRFFGEDVKNINVATFGDAMEAVKNGEADYAVLPIDNSTTGMVNDVYDLLEEYDNYIIAEQYVKIEHALLGLPGATLDDIRTVYSHPQGLMQCQKYLDGHRGWSSIRQSNTAMSAKLVVEENDISKAAIASQEAGKVYGLKVLDEKINDNDRNTTRFVIVSNKRCFVKGAGKMSICFETDNRTGALYNLLSHIIYNGLNMMKIESRPIEGREWEFRFFVDFEGNIDDVNVINALHGIQEEANRLKFLGNY
jgi:chorismate mutase/prephenate dehydratase